jgi:hypothetical protein
MHINIFIYIYIYGVAIELDAAQSEFLNRKDLLIAKITVAENFDRIMVNGNK